MIDYSAMVGIDWAGLLGERFCSNRMALMWTQQEWLKKKEAYYAAVGDVNREIADLLEKI